MTEILTARVGCIDAEKCHLERVSMLSVEECERVCQDVFTLRDHWLQRHPEPIFFSLGAASYMDASQRRLDNYLQQASLFNSLLMSHFGWLYERLAATFADCVGGTCVYDPQLAYPGFHIFIGDGRTEGSASRHCDLQYQHIDWRSHPDVDLERQLSFTLALRLPAGGSGLYLWNVNDRLLKQWSDEERKRHINANQLPTYEAYEIGQMVVHNGHYLHQIARLRQMNSGDQRITLQGHAIAAGSGWILYW